MMCLAKLLLFCFVSFDIIDSVSGCHKKTHCQQRMNKKSCVPSYKLNPYPEKCPEYAEELTLKQFPGYFRNAKEQAAVLKLFYSANVQEEVVEQANYTSGGIKKVRTKRQAMFHSCCISTPNFIAPNIMYNADSPSREVNVLQFDEQKQYFLSEICDQARGCKTCGCQSSWSLASAVVFKDGYLRIDLVKIPGCCKCMNFGN